MNQARRAATRSPLQHVRSAFTRSATHVNASRAIQDPLERTVPTRSRRVASLAVPGVAAVMAVSGTAFAMVGTGTTEQLEAVPAAATLPERDTEQVSRSSERPSPAAETPSAAAMAEATETAAPVAPAEVPARTPQQLSTSSFTPSPKPTPTATSASASAAAKAKATSSSSPSASSSASSSPSASASSSTTTKATGSVANCPAPSGWLAANTQKVYEASCANFPYVTAYGGARPGDSGNHGTGRAIDIMVSGAAGWDIANYMRANASRLGVTEVIYQQKIWTTQRSSEGWRPMSDRGSATANHMDHVHVSTS